MRYTVDEIKEIVAALATQYRAERIYLFGSYARGDADTDSDIDLRIDKGGHLRFTDGRTCGRLGGRTWNPCGFDSYREPEQQVFEFHF